VLLKNKTPGGPDQEAELAGSVTPTLNNDELPVKKERVMVDTLPPLEAALERNTILSVFAAVLLAGKSGTALASATIYNHFPLYIYNYVLGNCAEVPFARPFTTAKAS
jgi:hypothetical protein